MERLLVALMVIVAVANRAGEAQPIREVFVAPPPDMQMAATNVEKQASKSGKANKNRSLQAGGSKSGKGFHHKHSSSGDDGYHQHDVFHTASGNQYGFARQSAYNRGKKGGKNKKYDSDAGYEESHPDVVVDYGDRVRKAPRSQSLQDASGDATVDRETTKHRRALNEDDSFFVFSGGDNERQDDGRHDDEDDDGEAAEQQEADDDDDDDEGNQRRRQEADDDYDD